MNFDDDDDDDVSLIAWGMIDSKVSVVICLVKVEVLEYLLLKKT